MIDRQTLLADLKPLVKAMEADLRARCDEEWKIDDGLTEEYEQARDADRTGITFEEWRADLITQVAVAWILSCVFVRFLEDNGLISPPRISGPLHDYGAGGMQRARDEREACFRSHPAQTDRDYLLSVFDDLAELPGTKDVFGPHNLALTTVYRNWLSGDAAQKMIEFFQKIDADGTGEIVHDFTDPDWDTRFLGDLYQDMSEAARKKYALLQTPVFVEEFILERTLEPAIEEFGLLGFKMIDPACGSGHFLLGAFFRILAHWRAREPSANNRELVNRALASIHGVDLNPFAVSIARFRLLLAAMRECGITTLDDTPTFNVNLACGDSLLHGASGGDQQLLHFHELAHIYKGEDLGELRRILQPAQYHVAVANPPYITVKDPTLNAAYRDRYSACYRSYSLSVPFMQRLFQLCVPSGYNGQITANSFMTREFGKVLVEHFLPTIDVTAVVDASGAYIPGHGTPTLIIFARNRAPVSTTVRVALGVTSEPATPAEPARGLVWTAITAQLDVLDSDSDYITVVDLKRANLAAHPWCLRGGGALGLIAKIEGAAQGRLRGLLADIGFGAVTREDDVYLLSRRVILRRGIAPQFMRPLIEGDCLRDWMIVEPTEAIWPYDETSLVATPTDRVLRTLWPWKAQLSSRIAFGKTQLERGLTWYEYSMFFRDRYRPSCRLSFPKTATHNHFVLSDELCVFKDSAPVLVFPSDQDDRSTNSLIGQLNSSTVCFWMKQVFAKKGGGGIGRGLTPQLYEKRYDFDVTKIQACPVMAAAALPFANAMCSLGRTLQRHARELSIEQPCPTSLSVTEHESVWRSEYGRMCSYQEEIDWGVYRLYGLVEDDVLYKGVPPELVPGERAFEIVLARQMAAGDVKTTWFERHNSTPITEIPNKWPRDYQRVVTHRIEVIESDQSIGLIESPEYKRRWSVEPWLSQLSRALSDRLLDRLESYFDLDGRMNDRREVTVRGNLIEPRLTSVAQVADLARGDTEFMQVAEIFTGRMDFDTGVLVRELVTAESVPTLPVLRYDAAALDKHAAWVRTWELQRLEDDVDRVFEVDRLMNVDPARAEAVLGSLVASLNIDERSKLKVLHEAVEAAAYVAEAVKQKLSLESDAVLRPVRDAAKRAKKAAVGDIPVPPKYTSADFQSSDYWRLRGKLDVPKERWVSFPYCEGEDGTLVVAWAGYDHLQMARAIAERYEIAKEQEGRTLVPLLAAIGQLIPWLKQWHNDVDPAYGTRMGDYFESYLTEEAKALGMTVENVMAWTPPVKPKKAGRKKKS